MNRNYGYQFAYNNDGSGFEECAEDYRGPEAFSEPETAAMRDFLIEGDIQNSREISSGGESHMAEETYLHPGSSEEDRQKVMTNCRLRAAADGRPVG